MAIINKFDKIFRKITYGKNRNNIGIITDNYDDSTIIKVMKKYDIHKNGSKNENVILVWYKNPSKYDDIVTFVNKQIKLKKVLVLVVNLNFDFHNFVTKCVSSSIDSIYWHNEDGTKHSEYCIIVNPN